MKYLAVCAVALFVLCFSPPSFAQSEGVTVNEESITDLIKTLESDTAREEFIDNLKTLKDASGESDEAPAEAEPMVLSQVLGVEEQVGSIAASYEAFLDRHNLNDTLVGKLLVTLGLAFIFAVLAWVVRKAGVALRDKLLAIKNRYALGHNRFRTYARMVRYCGYVIVGVSFIGALGAVWNVSDFAFLKTQASLALFGDFLNIFCVVLIAIGLWETINGFIEFGLRSADRQARNRLRTLLPIVRNVAFVVFAVLFTLVLLSEIGINVVPLLAGAGVVGIAVGFGAQTMVKDFLAGFTIILEDLIQVGDVATLGGRTGAIEKITIRKVQLRGLDGTVYTVPFSEINIIENLSKDFSFYLFDIGVAYRENPDEVIGYLKEIDEEMRGEADYKDKILEPLHILGVDSFADSAVMIKARLKTKPLMQWDIGREFNRRMKHKFDAHNVEIPFPHQTIYFGEDKEGKAPAAPIMIKGAEKLPREDSSENREEAA